MYLKTLQVLILCVVFVARVRACFKSPLVLPRQVVVPVPSVPCGLDMQITHHLPNHTLTSGSLTMVSGSVLAQSLFWNLTEDNSKTMIFNGRSKDRGSFQDIPEYCEDENGNWTTGTVFLMVYGGFRKDRSTPFKAQIGLKFNAACKIDCNDWIEVRIHSQKMDPFGREYFYEDPSTTVKNGIGRSVNNVPTERNVGFGMAVSNQKAVVARAENQDFIVSAKLEKEALGNRLMKVIVYPNRGESVAVIVDANM